MKIKTVIILIVLLGFPFFMDYFIIGNNFSSNVSNDSWVGFLGSYVSALIGIGGVYIQLEVFKDEKEKEKIRSLIEKELGNINFFITFFNSCLNALERQKENIENILINFSQDEEHEYILDGYLASEFMNIYTKINYKHYSGELLSIFLQVKGFEKLFNKICLENKELFEYSEAKRIRSAFYNNIIKKNEKEKFKEEINKLNSNENLKKFFLTHYQNTELLLNKELLLTENNNLKEDLTTIRDYQTLMENIKNIIEKLKEDSNEIENKLKRKF